MNEDFDLINKKKDYYIEHRVVLQNSPDDNYGSKKDMLQAEFLTTYNYESTAIEGTPLTRIEHYGLLFKDQCPATERMTTIYEAINHADAFRMVTENATGPLTEHLLLEIHQILMHHILDGGKYRKCNVRVRNASHSFPSHEQVPQLMAQFFEKLEDQKGLHPIELASWVHEAFVTIHPFEDGNGRTARLLMNYILIHNGYLPVSIPVEKKLDYFILMDNYYSNRDISPFVKMVAKVEEKHLDRVIAVLEPIMYPLLLDYEQIQNEHPENYIEELRVIMDNYRQEVKEKRGF